MQSAGEQYTITENGIGSVKLAMTLFETKQAFPEATFSQGSDGAGAALVNVGTKESMVIALFADKRDAGRPINGLKIFSFI